MNKLPELLLPAGSPDSAYSAINGGADAIYLGGKNFSARNFADNFSDEEIIAVIEHALLRKVKVYIAVNTLYSNDEMPKVLDFVKIMHSQGAAAFIVQDIGLGHILKTHFPEIEIHASTQLTIHSLEGVNFMGQMGFSRVVLARELSLEQVKFISENANIETEVFAHGALCTSYSGQCLMSSQIGGRSGNRGRCAQPCRLNYDLLKNDKVVKSGYLLSPKDMMSLTFLDDILETKVSSLKIEGRMKSPEYVYIIAKAYREKLDGNEVSQKTINDVTQIFNRGGSFSTGFGASLMSTDTPKSTGIRCGEVVKYQNGKCSIKFTEKMIGGDGIEIWTSKPPHVGTGINKIINPNEIAEFPIQGGIKVGNNVYKSYDKALFDYAKRERQIDRKKAELTGKIQARLGEKLSLTLNDIEITFNDIIQEAKNAPMSKDDIISQLSKTGGTPFTIRFGDVDIDENIFISKTTLNEIRRTAISQVEKEIIRASKKPINHVDTPINSGLKAKKMGLTVQISNKNQLATILNHDVKRVYVSSLEGTQNLKDIEVFLTLPSISKNDKPPKDCSGYLVRTYGQLNILKNTDKKLVLDHNFNIFNSWSKAAFDDIKNIEAVTLSQELNIEQLKKLEGGKTEIIVYGRSVLMTTHNCPVGLYDKCNKGKYELLDRKNMKFPIVTDCNNCITYILNSKTLDISPKFRELPNIENIRLIFTDEDDIETVDNVLSVYSKLLEGKDFSLTNPDNTYGHFFRGVE